MGVGAETLFATLPKVNVEIGVGELSLLDGRYLTYNLKREARRRHAVSEGAPEPHGRHPVALQFVNRAIRRHLRKRNLDKRHNRKTISPCATYQ